MPIKVVDRSKILTKFANHKQRRREHARTEMKLRRELGKLIEEAQTCEPPFLQEEIAGLTGLSQQTISRAIKARNETER